MSRAKTNLTNTSGLSVAAIADLNKLGMFRNNWRQRMVTIYAIPDSAEVITVGEGFGEAVGHTVITRESRADYKRQLEQNDWSAYN